MRPVFECAADRALIMLLTENNVRTVPIVAVV